MKVTKLLFLATLLTTCRNSGTAQTPLSDHTRSAMNQPVKILFRFFSNVLDEETVETIWANVVDKEKGHYQLDNIPFYAPMASGDTVFATYDAAEQMLVFRKTIAYSGNSTIQVVLMDEAVDIQSIRGIFEKLGAVSEQLNDHYFSMEIPSGVDYKPIKRKLDELEQQNVIGYAEPCLAEGHR